MYIYFYFFYIVIIKNNIKCYGQGFVAQWTLLHNFLGVIQTPVEPIKPHGKFLRTPLYNTMILCDLLTLQRLR